MAGSWHLLVAFAKGTGRGRGLLTMLRALERGPLHTLRCCRGGLERGSLPRSGSAVVTDVAGRGDVPASLRGGGAHAFAEYANSKFIVQLAYIFIADDSGNAQRNFPLTFVRPMQNFSKQRVML